MLYNKSIRLQYRSEFIVTLKLSCQDKIRIPLPKVAKAHPVKVPQKCARALFLLSVNSQLQKCVVDLQQNSVLRRFGVSVDQVNVRSNNSCYVAVSGSFFLLKFKTRRRVINMACSLQVMMTTKFGMLHPLQFNTYQY